MLSMNGFFWCKLKGWRRAGYEKRCAGSANFSAGVGSGELGFRADSNRWRRGRCKWASHGGLAPRLRTGRRCRGDDARDTSATFGDSKCRSGLGLVPARTSRASSLLRRATIASRASGDLESGAEAPHAKVTFGAAAAFPHAGSRLVLRCSAFLT